MSSTLRAITVASCTAVLVAGAVTSAGATGAPAFRIHPTFGQVGSTLTLSGSALKASDKDVTIGGVPATVKSHSGHKLVVTVPAGAHSGAVTASDGTTSLTGPTYTVQLATSATATVSTPQVTFTHPVVVTGALKTRTGGKAVARQTAYLQHRVAGSTTWRHAFGTKARRTGPRGLVSWRLDPASSGAFRVYFTGTRSFAASTSAARTVRVHPLLHVNGVHTVPELSASTISGTIRPRVTGPIYLQRFVNGSWHRSGKAEVAHGRFAFTIAPSSFEPLRYRVVRRYDGSHTAAISRTLRLTVVHRTLVLGDHGPDVKALQKRLRRLHYDIGSVDGSYGWDAEHAVTAFEKVQGMSPNGEVSTKVWAALNHPKRIHLRYPIPGVTAVEVNLKKQVLLIAKNGRIWRILDTSTAGGYLYTNSEGGTSRAITPTGHFSIQYKLTGTRVSKLGTLYYPSYFTTTGYAIHGEGNTNSGGNVPPYPNSHGCVRITDNAVLRYYSLLAVGTSVWIYH
jgi:N-acetylmuramoyl-L-alanine amidase